MEDVPRQEVNRKFYAEQHGVKARYQSFGPVGGVDLAPENRIPC
jgi:hypothetical protein